MSATIKVEEDPVDSYFDVNKELGYSNDKELKGINVKQNLKKMLDKMDYIKKNYKKKKIYRKIC